MKFKPNRMGFHWQGRNKQGVSKWAGSVTPLKWIGTIFSIYGPIAGVGGLAALAYMLVTHSWSAPALPLMLEGLIHGVVFTSIGQWALSMRRHILRLVRAEDVSAKYGVEAKELQELTLQRNIRPHIILNDEPYYDPTEFVDALSLLRASSAQQISPATLLRPASGALESQSDDLLRADLGTQSTPQEEVQINTQSQWR